MYSTVCTRKYVKAPVRSVPCFQLHTSSSSINHGFALTPNATPRIYTEDRTQLLSLIACWYWACKTSKRIADAGRRIVVVRQMMTVIGCLQTKTLAVTIRRLPFLRSRQFGQTPQTPLLVTQSRPPCYISMAKSQRIVASIGAYIP